MASNNTMTSSAKPAASDRKPRSLSLVSRDGGCAVGESKTSERSGGRRLLARWVTFGTPSLSLRGFEVQFHAVAVVEMRSPDRVNRLRHFARDGLGQGYVLQ